MWESPQRSVGAGNRHHHGWTGREKIARVDISTDGGHGWAPAALQEPVLNLCQTRFRYPWKWDGGEEAMLMSRATDETGDVQLTLEAARGAREANKHVRHWNTNAGLSSKNRKTAVRPLVEPRLPSAISLVMA